MTKKEYISTFCSLHPNPIEQELCFYGYTPVGYMCACVCTQPACAAGTRLNLRKRTRECWSAGFIGTGQAAFLSLCSTRTRANRRKAKCQLMPEKQTKRFTQSNEHSASLACHWAHIHREVEKSIQVLLSFRSAEARASTPTPEAAAAPRPCSMGWSTCWSTAVAPEPPLVLTQKGAMEWFVQSYLRGELVLAGSHNSQLWGFYKIATLGFGASEQTEV